MKIAFHPIYHHPLPESHRFPMEKYTLLEGQIRQEGLDQEGGWIMPSEADEQKILRTHCPVYWNRLKNGTWSRQEERKSGFKWSPQLIRRETIIMQGSMECALHALNGGIALNIAGGTHHAFRDSPEGFCLLNDLMMSAHEVLETDSTARVLVVDLDVHQGNGTASLAQGDPRIFTFSMHGRTNYPFHKEKSDLDIALEDGTQDAEYLQTLHFHLDGILDAFNPTVVLYQSGVDVLASDKLGKLALSLKGCMERDRLVLSRCRDRDVGVACAMGGGYSPDIRTIVEAHMQTFRVGRDLWS